jgi:hypothetical protein
LGRWRLRQVDQTEMKRAGLIPGPLYSRSRLGFGFTTLAMIRLSGPKLTLWKLNLA